LARLITDWAVEQGLPRGSLWQLANHLDGFFHGRASGIDSGLALADGPRAFVPAPNQKPAFSVLDLSTRSPERWIVYTAIKRQGSTRELVAAIQAGMEARDVRVVHGLSALGQISRQAIDLIQNKGSAETLGHLANQAQSLLGNLGLSTPALESVLTIGRAAGAHGGKLSGAGGGGACYFWTSSQEQARSVTAALEEATTAGNAFGIILSTAPDCFRLA
jgi:mevalonate kinase